MDWASSHPPAPLLSPYHQFAVSAPPPTNAAVASGGLSYVPYQPPPLTPQQQQQLLLRWQQPPQPPSADSVAAAVALARARAPPLTVTAVAGSSGGGVAMTMPRAASELQAQAALAVGTMRPFVPPAIAALLSPSHAHAAAAAPSAGVLLSAITHSAITNPYHIQPPTVYSRSSLMDSNASAAAAAAAAAAIAATATVISTPIATSAGSAAAAAIAAPTPTRPAANPPAAMAAAAMASDPPATAKDNDTAASSDSKHPLSRSERDRNSRQAKIAAHTAQRARNELGMTVFRTPSGGFKRMYDPAGSFFMAGNESRAEYDAVLLAGYAPPIITSTQPHSDGDTELDAFRCQIRGCSALFHSVAEYDAHFNARHKHTCRVCRMSFSSSRLCDLHFGERHDQYFALLSKQKPMFECLVDGCSGRFVDRKHRKHHLVKVHRYPNSFVFDTKPKARTANALAGSSAATHQSGAGASSMSDQPTTKPVRVKAVTGTAAAAVAAAAVTTASGGDAEAAAIRKAEIAAAKKAKLKQKKRDKQLTKRQQKPSDSQSAMRDATAAEDEEKTLNSPFLSSLARTVRPASTAAASGVAASDPALSPFPSFLPSAASTSAATAARVIIHPTTNASPPPTAAALRLPFNPRSVQLKNKHAAAASATAPTATAAGSGGGMSIYHQFGGSVAMGDHKQPAYFNSSQFNSTVAAMAAAASVDASMPVVSTVISRRPKPAALPQTAVDAYSSTYDDAYGDGDMSIPADAAARPVRVRFGKSRHFK